MEVVLMISAVVAVMLAVALAVLAFGFARLAATGQSALQQMADLSNLEETPSGIAKLLDSTRVGKVLRSNHEAANSKYSYNKFLSLTVMLGVSTAVAVAAWLRDPAGGLILGMLVLALPPAGDFMAAGKLSQELDESMPGALETMVASLRAGASLPQAIAVVASDLGGPLGALFKAMSRDFDMGMSLEEALVRARRKTKSREFETLCMVLIALRRAGGDLAQVLERLAETSRSRQRARMEIQTTLQESKTSSGILLALPAVGMLMMYVQDTSYFAPLIGNRYGLPILAGGLVLWLVGFIVVRLLTRIEVN